MLTSPLTVLAHAGGWDEILIFGGPVLVLYLAMRWWDRRKDAERGEDANRPRSEPSDEGSGIVDDLEGPG